MYASTSSSGVNAPTSGHNNYIPRATSPLSRSSLGNNVNENVESEKHRSNQSYHHHHQSFSSIPAIVAPTPRYALNDPGPSTFSRTGNDQSQQTQLNEEEEERMQNFSHFNPRSPAPKYNHDVDYSNVLPTLGHPSDAQSALDKLERLKKQKQHKRKWRRRLLMPAETPDERQQKKNFERRENNDGDSIASSLNLYEEVRLAISGVPGFTALTSKARQALDNSDENVSSKILKSDERRGSLPFRFGSQRRKSISSQKPQAAQISESLLTAQTDGVPSLPQNQDVETNFKQNPPTADLMPLKEERKIEEATDILTNGTFEDKPIKPKAERPRLMIQSPTEKTVQTDLPMMQSPDNIEPPPNQLSSFFQRDKEDISPAQIGSDEVSSSSNRPTPSPGPCDAIAVEAAEHCRRNMSRPSIFDELVGSEDMHARSINTPSSVDSGIGSQSDSEGTISSSEEEKAEDQIRSLNLEHGNQMTRKQEKRLLRQLRRDARRNKAQKGAGAGIEVEGVPGVNVGRVHRRTASLTNHISTGLHYASSQSRNRRAMEKYSPHPSRPPSAKPWQNAMNSMTNGFTPVHPNSLGGTISRSSTPANAGVGSERSSFSVEEGVNTKNTSGMDSRPDSVRNGILNGGIPLDENEDDVHKYNLLKRWGTNQSTASSNLAPNGSIKGASFKKRFFSLRRGTRQQPSDVLEEDIDLNSPQQEQESAERELEKALGKLVVEQAPEELEEKFEFDVLYENQRGMLFFGIPKFSSKTLFHWDPASWTNVFNKDSAYNIVNAQLPNPSWEWVHPEWMIDMSGDVDESGWQYSYNFGNFPLNLFYRSDQIVPRANAKGNEITNERFNKAIENLEKRKKDKEDDGFEALKRSAITREAKWSGIPTQNTYVRRRRWIRLRRRKPMEVPHGAVNTPKVGTPSGLSKTSNDWAHLIKSDSNDTSTMNRKPGSLKADSGSVDPVWSKDDDQLLLSDFEEGSTSSSSSLVGSSDVENVNGTQGESGFLPRRLEGNLKNRRDPMQVRKDAYSRKEQIRRKRHAREFTGTIRELKSLLPSIMDRKAGSRSHRSYSISQQMQNSKYSSDRQKQLWLLEIDARNPFLSWSFIKRRLEDDDLAFASTSLRARERRYAKRQLDKHQSKQSGEHLWDQFELTKDALIEINLRRVLRVLKACKLDRQKIQLWKIWLNIDQMNSNIIEPSRNEDLIQLGLAASSAAASDTLIKAKDELAKLAKTRWRSAFTPADPVDVWDVIERKLDRLLLTFEYQNGRAAFLRLLLTIHAVSHPNHRFKPHSHLRFGGIGNEGSIQIDSDTPSTLLPYGHNDDKLPSSSGDEWRTARVPRLEFWSDLIDCARSLIDSKSPQQGILVKNQQEQDSATGVVQSTSSTSLGSPIILPALTFAMTPLSRTSTPILGGNVTISPPNIPVHLSLISSPNNGIVAGKRRQSSTAFTSSPPIGSNQSVKHTNNSTSTSNYGSPPLKAGASQKNHLEISDQVLLTQLLRLPIQKQKDVLLQMKSSVFENKVDHSQAHQLKNAAVTTTTSPMIGEIEGGEGDETMLTIKQLSQSPDQDEDFDNTTILVNDLPPIQHDRTDSELVQRLSQAIGED